MGFENLSNLNLPAARESALVLTALSAFFFKWHLLFLKMFLLSQSFLGCFPLKGLAPSTLLPRLTWVTSPYTFSKLGMSSSASLWEVQSRHHHQEISCGDTQKPSGHIFQGTLVEQRGGME